MPSTYTSNLGIELPADGELDGVWGDVTNDNMSILDRGINGVLSLSLSGTTSTLTTSDGALSDGQYKLLLLTGSPSGTHTITLSPTDAQKIYFVRNTTAQSVIFTQGSGGNVTIATGDSGIIYADGGGASATIANLTDHFAMSSVNITGGSINGTTIGATTASTIAGTTGTFSGNLTVDGQASFSDGTAAAPSITNTGDTNTGIYFPAADSIGFSVVGTEVGRFNNVGDLLIGTTSTYSASYRVSIALTAATGGIVFRTPAPTGAPLAFQNSVGTEVGFVSTTNVGTTYNVTSDYRLKENVQPMQDALSKIAQLNPVTYNWKSDGSDGQGFIAHELQAVIPDCVTGDKDAVDAEGKPKYQGIDTSFLVATLVAATKEQQAIITALTARITALEAAQ